MLNVSDERTCSAGNLLMSAPLPADSEVGCETSKWIFCSVRLYCVTMGVRIVIFDIFY